MWMSGIAATHHDDRMIAESTEQAMTDLKGIISCTLLSQRACNGRP